ncbi:hypothetical protein [Longimicrobium sp.]|uniref:hypothetical protein n=1 Tax=Longimicrobium sp. TaxID=2029185 RepID=UPI002EDA6E75
MPGAGVAGGEPDPDPRLAKRNQALLRLRSLAVRDVIRPGPAGSISTPTGLGLDVGEIFVGAAFQARTRYTTKSDAGAAVGIGIGSRDVIAAEFALTTYSTIRGAGPFETGSVSAKLHRALPYESAIAVGVENAALWGEYDTERSYFGALSHLVRRGDDPDAPLNAALLTVGVGNGRFRTEDAIRNRREGVNVFASAGVRVIEPVSLLADWTGQDLDVAASFTPIRGMPFVITPGLADVLGTAGDGARFILAVGYGMSLRSAF